MNKSRVVPDPGWGWIWKETKKIDVPEPFLIEFDREQGPGYPARVGNLTYPGHPLSGKWIVLVPIGFAEPAHFYNLWAFATKPVLTSCEELDKSAAVSGFAHFEESAARVGKNCQL